MKIKRKGLFGTILIITVAAASLCYTFLALQLLGTDQSGDYTSSGITDSGKMPEPDADNSSQAINNQISSEIPVMRQQIKDGQYEEANRRAAELLAKSPNNPELINVSESSKNITEYTGVVEHIFFHPLIAYPNRAFKSKGQDMYMITVYEFNKILEEVYKRGYILVDLAQLYDVQYDESGAAVKVTPKKLMLPAGKKPLVISIDDLNYYEYMLKEGQVFKLVLDKNNEIETYSVDESGREVYSKTNEIVPIINEFVKTHPDFSFNGAKGTINLTGYEGVLGYRTNSLKYSNYESERAEARKVIEVLKKTGWSFASHSQGHRHFAQISYNLTVEDTDRFAAEVEPLIGKTPIFVYPYGEQVKVTDPKFKYFQSKGFAIFCGVSKVPASVVGGSYILMNRRNVDGIALKDNRNSALYEAKDVTDPLRPWYQQYFGNAVTSESVSVQSDSGLVSDYYG